MEAVNSASSISTPNNEPFASDDLGETVIRMDGAVTLNMAAAAAAAATPAHLKGEEGEEEEEEDEEEEEEEQEQVRLVVLDWWSDVGCICECRAIRISTLVCWMNRSKAS